MTTKRAFVIIGVVLAVLIAAIWLLVRFAGLEASLLWTAIIGAIAWSVQNGVERKREHERLLAENKRAHYFEFLDFLNRFITPSRKTVGEETEVASNVPEVTVSPDEFRKWSIRLTLIGSDDVVRAWNAARVDHTSADAESNVIVLRNWGRLWLAMRRDCGHPDTKLTATDILASFVNDIERHRRTLDNDGATSTNGS